MNFSIYFDVVEDLCYCKDVSGLFNGVGIKHDQTQWRLSVDSFTKSLKALLLHSGNEYPSIPLTYSIQMKEDYKNVKQVLLKIKYAEFNWYWMCGFKMLGLLLGLHSAGWLHQIHVCSLLVQQQG